MHLTDSNQITLHLNIYLLQLINFRTIRQIIKFSNQLMYSKTKK